MHGPLFGRRDQEPKAMAAAEPRVVTDVPVVLAQLPRR